MEGLLSIKYVGIEYTTPLAASEWFNQSYGCGETAG
jgi:hypothetical protein